MTLNELFSKKKSVNVGYIGGSITENDGYRNVLTKFLTETYPNNEINEIAAGQGGTNSFLGVCRIERDLISKFCDVAFVEFSVNDCSDKPQEYFRFFERTYEGMIRKLLKSNPDMLIVGVGLTTKAMNEKFYEKGVLPHTVTAHTNVCNYYNIPYVNAGKAMYDDITRDNADMMKYTGDNVHTNELGGKFYGDFIWNEIKNYEFNIKNNDMPLHEDNLENAMLYMAGSPENGWEKGEWKWGRDEQYIYSCTPGSELTVQFSGTVFGIYCTTEKTSGNIKYSTDGNEWKETATWDKYAISFPRLHFYCLEDDLKKGDHTVTIKVSENKEEKSEGYYLRIIAFLVEKP